MPLMNVAAACGNGTARWCDTRPGRATRRPARCRGWLGRCRCAARASRGRRRARPPCRCPRRARAQIARAEQARRRPIAVQLVEAHAPVARAAERELALHASGRRDRRRKGPWRSVRRAADRGTPAAPPLPAPSWAGSNDAKRIGIDRARQPHVDLSRVGEHVAGDLLLAVAARAHEPQAAQIPAVAVPGKIGFRAVEVERAWYGEPAQREVAGELQRGLGGQRGGNVAARQAAGRGAAAVDLDARLSRRVCARGIETRPAPEDRLRRTRVPARAGRGRSAAESARHPCAGLKSPCAVRVPWRSVSSRLLQMKRARRVVELARAGVRAGSCRAAARRPGAARRRAGAAVAPGRPGSGCPAAAASASERTFSISSVIVRAHCLRRARSSGWRGCRDGRETFRVQELAAGGDLQPVEIARAPGSRAPRRAGRRAWPGSGAA